MIPQHPDESAAIERAVQRNGADVQEQAARDAKQANDAETWTFRDAHKVAVWQDLLHQITHPAAFAEREIERDQRDPARADAIRKLADALDNMTDGLIPRGAIEADAQQLFDAPPRDEEGL